MYIFDEIFFYNVVIRPFSAIYMAQKKQQRHVNALLLSGVYFGLFETVMWRVRTYAKPSC